MDASRDNSSKRRLGRSGFTLVEMMIVLTVLGTITAFALPQLNRTTRQRRVIAAASAVASDVESAYSLAARQRRPLRVTYHSASGEIRIADRASGTVYRRRPLRMSSEYHLDAVALGPSPVDIFPTGVSSAGFSISLTNGDYQRQILVTRTGLARVVKP